MAQCRRGQWKQTSDRFAAFGGEPDDARADRRGPAARKRMDEKERVISHPSLAGYSKLVYYYLLSNNVGRGTCGAELTAKKYKD